MGVVAISAAALNDVVGWVLLAGVSAYAAAHFSFAHRLSSSAAYPFVALLWFVLRPPRAMADCQLSQSDGGAIDAESHGHRRLPDLRARHLHLRTRHIRDLRRFRGRPRCSIATRLSSRRGTARSDSSCWCSSCRSSSPTPGSGPTFSASTRRRLGMVGHHAHGRRAGQGRSRVLRRRGCRVQRSQSAILGSLMNTRALMELIVLNIGYDLRLHPAKRLHHAGDHGGRHDAHDGAAAAGAAAARGLCRAGRDRSLATQRCISSEVGTVSSRAAIVGPAWAVSDESHACRPDRAARDDRAGPSAPAVRPAARAEIPSPPPP